MRSDELTLNEQEVIDLAAGICEAGFPEELGFQSRANRDAVAAEAKRRGAVCKKSSMANQVIDPRYTVEGRHMPDRGLANTTVWTNIYFLERTL